LFEIKEHEKSSKKWEIYPRGQRRRKKIVYKWIPERRKKIKTIISADETNQKEKNLKKKRNE
jgi:hypothetical protein